MHRRTLPPARLVTSPAALLPSLPEHGQPVSQVGRDADARGRRCPDATRRSWFRAMHLVLGTPIGPPFPEGIERAIFGMGCFWGAERMFWQAPGRLHDRGRLRGRLHAEPDVRGGLHGPHRATTRSCSRSSTPSKTSYEAMLTIFWEGHDPTQGMRQGNDVGTQYRSGIYWTSERAARRRARLARHVPAGALAAPATGRSRPRSSRPGPFYYAEDYHQQYLAANPNGYCGLGGTGVSCPAPATAASE